MASMFSLEGSTAVVTGATRGIGQAVAIGLAEAGADIILIQVGFNCRLAYLLACLCAWITGLTWSVFWDSERYHFNGDQRGR